MECIVLAGGLGTRLRGVVGDLPKCLAPVAGRPFLGWMLDNLELCGFDHIILSLGFGSDAVQAFLAQRTSRTGIECVVEREPLGTGGAIRLALTRAREESVFVINGDTWFDLSFREMLETHRESGATATLALKPMRDFDRYGTVSLGEDGRTVEAFHEKAPCAEGLINGGIYLLRRDALEALPEKFSMEREWLEPQVASGCLASYVSDGYFLDIGIPEDYQRAQADFFLGAHKRYDTLFLDRDGVIDVELESDYVKRPEEMIFIPGALEAIARLQPLFARTLVVTNQRGVAKGVMTLGDLERVHRHMLAQVEAAGGHIDKIYFSTGMDESDPLRKPNPGMYFAAREDFPLIDPERSLMVGDKPTDMAFAANCGLTGVLVGPRYGLKELADELLANL